MKEESLNTWISCLGCGQRVSRDSIHTCSPQTKPAPDGCIDPKSYYEGYEDGIQSLTVTDPRPVAFMKDFGGFTDDPVLAIQDGFNIPVYVTKADYQKIKQKKPYDAPQTKPLSDEELLQIYTKYSTYDNDQRLFVDIYGFARAIEERHGIK
jgi:hypothetical protein